MVRSLVRNKIKSMKPKAIIVSGYFNPIHKGHIEYFNYAKACGDRLIVMSIAIISVL